MVDTETYDFDEHTRPSWLEMTFLNSKRIYFCAVFFGVVGLIFQLLWGDAWLSRSGALITLLAIGMVWAVMKTQSKLYLIETYLEGSSKLHVGGTNQILREAKWQRVFGYATVVFDGDDKELGVRSTKLIKALGSKSDAAMNSQFLLALIGTLIWAFGDLLPGGILC